MKKLRVWWIPQLGINKTFYVTVSSPEEGWKLLQILAVYDLYQLEQRVKPDFCNAGGLQEYNEEKQAWEDWYDDDYYDDIDSYTSNLDEVDPVQAEKLESWKEEMFKENLMNYN